MSYSPHHDDSEHHSHHDVSAPEATQKVGRRGPTFKKDITRRRSKGDPPLEVSHLLINLLF